MTRRNQTSEQQLASCRAKARKQRQMATTYLGAARKAKAGNDAQLLRLCVRWARQAHRSACFWERQTAALEAECRA